MNDTMLDNQFDLEDVMSKNMVTIKPTTSIREAAEMLAEGHFHSLPIVDKSGDLQGLVTSTDLIRYLLKQYWCIINIRSLTKLNLSLINGL